jgi:hypothetical protein
MNTAIGAIAATIVATIAIGVDVAGQSTPRGRQSAKAGGSASKTPWGDPDLQGYWSYATVTPLERPGAQGDKEVLTDEEVAAVNEEAATNADRRDGGAEADVARAYNAFWWDRGKSTGRTSLIVDPPNGRLPSLTEAGKQRQAARAERRRDHPADSWEDRTNQDRCITYHGVPPLPTGYNNHYHIVQSPGLVAILDENIHDVRRIPVDGTPHLPPSVRQWNGDSRGHWEGDTLVVETTNYHPQSSLRFPTFNETLRAVERFTRVAPDRMDYQFTIYDAATYTSPWTAELPMTAFQGPIFEYACHEGNYAMRGILSAARAAEKAEAGGKKGSR